MDTESIRPRSFLVSDDGDAFEVALFVGDQQVAAVLVPDSDGSGVSLALASELGQLFAGGFRVRS